MGFIKASRHYRSCILQIHANGIPVGNGASLELYAFYRDGADLIAEQIAVLNCFRRNISARLPIAESRFPEGRPLPQIDGFFIRLPGNRSALFWMASAFFFEVDMNRLRIASSETTSLENTGSEPAANVSEAEGSVPVTNTPRPEEASAPADILAAEENTGEPAAPAAPSEPEAPSEPPTPSEPSTPSTPSTPPGKPSAKKIQRSDISVLPRRFWFLANNSFLLHGYHNYNHLLLAEEDGRLWLGVPGIYDPREAKVADLFGFPQFTREYADCLELEPEECSDNADFGYWCRCVGAGRIG